MNERPATLRRLLRDPALIRRLVVVDFAIALAALLAVVAIADPDGGRLLAGSPASGPIEADDGGRRFAGGGRGRPDEPRVRAVEPGQAPLRPAAPGSGVPQGAPEERAGGGVSSGPAPPAASGSKPGAVSPPRDGSYRQRVTTSSPDGEEDEEVTTSYTTTARTDGETRQRAEGSGPSSFTSPTFGGADQTLIWRRDGLFVEQSADESPMGGGCEPAEYLLLQLPLGEGRSWEATTECTFGFGEGFGGSFRSESRSVVRRAAVVDVAGRSIPVWEIHTTTKSTGSFTDEGESRQFEAVVDALQYFSPAHGLFVLAHGTYHGSDGNEEQRGSFRAESLNVEPE